MKKFKKVLFIDEDRELVKIYHSILARKDLSDHLIYVANAEDGINYLKKHRRKMLPDYILLDLSLPELAGLEFLRRFDGLGKMKNSIEVFVCTSIVNKDDRNKVMGYPFVSALLEKPLPGDFLELLILDDIHPGNYPGSHHGNYPGNYPGSYPGDYPGGYRGNHPGKY